MKFEDQTFKDQDILLDGNQYIECTFNRCQIIFKGVESMALNNPTFSDCRWHFNGPAGNTLKFLSIVYGLGDNGKQLVEAIITSIREGESPKAVH